VSYIVESGASRSRRSRRRRALITLVLVALMLFFAFWYAYSYYRSSGEAVAAPAPTCTTAAPAAPAAPAKAAAAPKPADITINVYNATSRDGLAGKTASDVRERGFKVATVTNDPLQRTVTGTAEVRYGKSGAAKAKLVLGLVKGAKPVRDARTDASVDLVLGDKFTALTAPAKQVAAPAAGATVPDCR
jgi:zona occludens toxin (predicted ATPase)